jgi:hypothetical protein
MPLIVLVALLLFSSWLFSEVLVFFPLSVLHSLRLLGWLIGIVVLLVFLWCFGD